ncbi:serine/threonine-protein kinase [Streptomyces sp. NBC_00038]|uniref:serine/threonine-protein kinase n=1 Tax=Streptomyces sp. NBC_00038 TaxID=2903615 RepID=UPI0022507709|nr:serine/threonine-protein kinase [Streptomyces sp. NBC_00038]MCX5555625.1 serine/threonine protein kinase [Streptomyces sp. NBC_00038]
MSSGENEQPDGVGRLLADRYRVVAQLGRGGMGIVWRARDEVLGREVAVKELRTYTDAAAPELADLGRRMQREARAAARVSHPGVIAVHDVAEVDGRPLIVMELVDGPSLDDVLRERGTLDPREAASIGAKVMDALAAAHRAGVLHRDVKPGNILLDRSGRVVLTDFGIATMDDPGDGSTTHLTRSGELVGSLDYLAPERAQGNDPGPASDVWALGATLYAAVEGSSPFRRTSTWSTLTAIVVEPLPEPRLAGPLGPVLQQLMNKQPEARPDADRARELLEAVAGAPEADSATTGLRVPEPRPREATERSVPSVPPGFGPPVPVAPAVALTAVAPSPAPRRRGGRALLAAVAVVVVLAATGFTVALLNSPDDTGTTALPTPSDVGGTAPSDGAGRGSVDLSDDSKPTGKGDGKSKAPEKQPSYIPETTPEPSKTPANGGSTGGASGGGSGGSTDAGTTGGTTGGGSSSPTTPAAPVCDPIGGGKYNCQVWRTAKSYTASGTEVGVLNAGTNYFYCQQNLGRRETYGEWTNVWWARTDDDSGNTDVFVSDVYIKGGDNDAPLPGLPVC